MNTILIVLIVSNIIWIVYALVLERKGKTKIRIYKEDQQHLIDAQSKLAAKEHSLMLLEEMHLAIYKKYDACCEANEEFEEALKDSQQQVLYAQKQRDIMEKLAADEYQKCSDFKLRIKDLEDENENLKAALDTQ